MTTVPQISRKAINNSEELCSRKSGENKQQIHDRRRADLATFLAPNFSESNPLITQAILPIPTMKKVKRGIFSPDMGNLF